MELTIEQALQQGVAAHKEGKLQDAERLYRAILQSQPAHPDANHNLGVIAVSFNKADVALPLFKTALEANPKIGQFWLSYIDALIKEKQFDNAKVLLEQGRKVGLSGGKVDSLEERLTQTTQANDPKLIVEKKSLTLSEKRKKLAEDKKKKGKKQNLKGISPSKSDMNNLLQYYQTGRYGDAEKLAISMIQEFPTHQFGWKILGAILGQSGRLEEAVIANQKAVELSPQDAHVHSNLGVTLQELGRLEEAEASYTQAIALKPDYADAHYNLGILCFESKKYNLAAEQFELCDTHQSNPYAIQCSYLQDEETVFYEKFDLLVNQVKTNAVLGSLGFRSEFKYGRKKSNSFCNDPLKYVVKTDLNALYDFENIFIETAKAVLTDNSVSYKAQGHLTNGIQTAGNIFSQGKVPKTEIGSIIHAEIEKYRIQFKDSEEGFIKSWPTSYEIKGWLVCMQSGGKLAPHMHNSGWITGSIYINVPPKSETDSGNLVLCLSDQEPVAGVKKSQKSIIDVVTGSLCLFPSSLHHYTVPFEGKEDRIVLAFDVIPKDKMIN